MLNMKKKTLFKIEEKLKVLQTLTNKEIGQYKGGADADVTPAITLPPVVTFSFSPQPKPPPVKFTFNPPGGGITLTF